LAFGAPARMVLAFGAPAPNAGVLALVVGIVGRWRLSAAARSMVLAFGGGLTPRLTTDSQVRAPG